MSPARRAGIYHGTVVHRRNVRRSKAFTHRLWMAGVDLADPDAFAPRSRLLRMDPNLGGGRARGSWWSPVGLDRDDYLSGDTSLLETVRSEVEACSGKRPTGSVVLVAQPRTLGWLFNPIALYLVLDQNEELEALVVEVTNTPWHERHRYVLLGAGPYDFDKRLHVSPFLEDDRTYHLQLTTTEDRLVVQLSLHDGAAVELSSVLSLRRLDATEATLWRMFWRYPLLTLRVSMGIYRHAAELLAKGVPVVPHPAAAAKKLARRG